MCPKALEETQKGLDAAKAHPPDRADRHGLRNSMFGDVVQSLQLMIGNYRDMKRSANAYNYTAMLNSYNSAVERANLAR